MLSVSTVVLPVPRTLLMALLVLLVTSLVAVGDSSGNLTWTGADPTVSRDQHQTGENTLASSGLFNDLTLPVAHGNLTTFISYSPLAELPIPPEEGSARFANNRWQSLSKRVGTNVTEESKKILIKAAPLVQKVVGAKAVASFFQASNTGSSEVGGVDGPVAAFVAENNALSATYGVPPTQVELARPEAPLPSYNAPPRDPLPTYGAPPKVVVQPVPLSLPEVHQYANDQVVNHGVKEDVKYAVSPPLIKYALPEPVKYHVPAPELLPDLPVIDTVPAAPAHHYSYPAVPQPVQPRAAPAPFFYVPAQQAQQMQYIAITPAQASHLIGNQGAGKGRAKYDGKKPRKEKLGVRDKVQKWYNSSLNIAFKTSRILRVFWPGSWFYPTVEISQPVEITSAAVVAPFVDS